MRITTLLGAGAPLELNERAPSTGEITSAIRAIKLTTTTDSSSSFIDDVARELDQQFRDPACNFEEIFHTIEQLYSFSRGWTGAAREFTPYLTAFTNPVSTELFEGSNIHSDAKAQIIFKVGEMIDEHTRPK